jgi:hypothetical protein
VTRRLDDGRDDDTGDGGREVPEVSSVERGLFASRRERIDAFGKGHEVVAVTSVTVVVTVEENPRS